MNSFFLSFGIVRFLIGTLSVYFSLNRYKVARFTHYFGQSLRHCFIRGYRLNHSQLSRQDFSMGLFVLIKDFMRHFKIMNNTLDD